MKSPMIASRLGLARRIRIVVKMRRYDEYNTTAWDTYLIWAAVGLNGIGVDTSNERMTVAIHGYLSRAAAGDYDECPALAVAEAVS